MIKITTVKNREKQEIQGSLIKSYEILEEKLNQNNEKIKELKLELNRDLYQEKKREAVKNFAGPRKNSKLDK